MNIDMYIYIIRATKMVISPWDFIKKKSCVFFSEYHGDNGILLVIYKATKLLVYMILV